VKNWSEVEASIGRLKLDPHRLACGCAVKLDLQRVVYPALRAIRPQLQALGLGLAGREDADIFPRSAELSFRRRIYRFDAQQVVPLAPGAERRAVTVSSVYRPQSAPELARRWLEFYRALLSEGAGLQIGKGHTIEAYTPDDEFVHFDFYRPAGAARPGWQVANNDTIQLIDPTRELGAPEQSEVALSNALNDLFSLGAVEEIQVYPFYAAPSSSLAAQIAENMSNFCLEYGFAYHRQEPISENTLLIGATVFGASSRQLPTFYDRIDQGDLILVHRAFGDLAPINLLVEQLITGDGTANSLGQRRAELQRAVDERIAVMRRPNLAVGRLIQHFSPEMDEPFDEGRHIKVTTDISGPGVDVFRELAERVGRDVVLERLPLADEELVRRASENFLLPNGTAGTNGALALIGASALIERLGAELEALGHWPQIIGQVAGPGGRLVLPPEAKQYIADWPDAYRLIDKSR